MLRVASVVVLAGCLLVVGVRLGALFAPLPEDFFDLPSTIVRYQDGRIAHIFRAPDDAFRLPVTRLEQIDPHYIQALLAFEDQNFFEHGGVDIFALARASFMNVTAGRVVSGASTLTMQLARMREPRPRTLSSKLIEIFRAFQIEAQMSKPEILRAYLTYAPFGGNREGLRLASWSFFGHKPQHLSPHEIAVLLAIPQRPTPRVPSLQNHARLQAAQRHVLKALKARGLYPDTPLKGPVPNKVQPIPQAIPHLSYWLRAQFPEKLEFHTTIDATHQQRVESLLSEHQKKLEPLGIHNGLVLISHHESGELLAVTGSFDFWNPEHGSQIPGFVHPRSPGSTLKPFIYGRAIEAGLILPETLLADVPRTYPGYQPQNYNGRFDGAVPAAEALVRSLNLPFIELLRIIGVDSFLGELVSLGAHSLDAPPGRHGLAAAIGGVELTPLELAQLYGGLANNGQVMPLRWLRDQRVESPRRIWSPATSTLVKDTLSRLDRPDLPLRARLGQKPKPIFWKTGTSFAYHDAWTAGGTSEYTVIVWLGNFDHSASAHLVGSKTAAPLFFDIADGLTSPGPLPLPDEGLVLIDICPVSGLPVGPACPHRKKARALAHRVPTRRCPIHQFRWIDTGSGLAVEPGCKPEAQVERRRYEVWPQDMLRYLGPYAQQQASSLPAWDPQCRSRQPQPLRVLHPQAGTRLLVPGLAPSEQEVPFEADGPGEDLLWFVDGRFVGQTRPGERLWWTPTPGTHEILVMAEGGQHASSQIHIKSAPK